MREQGLVEGRRLLWAAGAATFVGFLGLAKPIFFLAFIVSFWGGIGGVSTTARALHASAAARFGGIALACFPPINLLPIAYFLFMAPSAQPAPPARAAGGGKAARPRAPSRPAAGDAPPPPQRQKPLLSRAMPYVKLAGVPGLDDGVKLSVTGNSAGVVLPEADEPIFLGAKGVFGVVHVVDTGEHLSYVNARQLREGSISTDDLRHIGLRNLTALVKGGGEQQPGLQIHPFNHAKGLTLGGYYEASLVLLDALWDGPLKAHAPHGAVVAIPARDVCAFCDAQSKEGIKELQGIIERVKNKGTHHISDQLFIRKGGVWQVMEVEDNSPGSELPPLDFQL